MITSQVALSLKKSQFFWGAKVLLFISASTDLCHQPSMALFLVFIIQGLCLTEAVHLLLTLVKQQKKQRKVTQNPGISSVFACRDLGMNHNAENMINGEFSEFLKQVYF